LYCVLYRSDADKHPIKYGIMRRVSVGDVS
jgi:hypothetical protein